MKLLIVTGLMCLGSAAVAGWGAIAWSPSTGNYGWAAGYTCQQDAEDAALSKCGGGDCEIMNWEQGLCNAFAASGGNWGESHGYSDSQSAIDAAVNACGADCAWQAWVCN